MRRQSPQDGTGVLEDDGKNNILSIIATAAPTDGQAGYQIGCFWRNTAGTAGGILYVNIGTLASSNWLNIC